MKMTLRRCFVLVYDHSGEPMVHSNEPGLPRTDVSGSEFEVGAPTLEEEVDRKNSRTKRAPKSLLTAGLENLLLSILHCRFLVISVAHFPSVSRWCRNDSGTFQKWRCFYRRGDWWALEGASHCCYQEPGTSGWGPQHDVLETVHSRCRSQELLERPFDDGNICVQMRNFLILFHVDSKLYHIFYLLDQFVTDPAASVIVPLVIRHCPCVASFVRRRKHNCCLP